MKNFLKNLRSKLRGAGFGALIAILCVAIVGSTIGCNKAQQQDIATLAQTLGSAGAQVAALEGNTALSAQITTDTNAAVLAITSFVPGTSPAQTVIQLINVVMADLSLIPAVGPYAQLIELALGTAEALIAEFSSQTNTPTVTPESSVKIKTVHLSNPPRNRKDFVKQWNAIAATNPQLASAAIK